jgi:hypothetical protein
MSKVFRAHVHRWSKWEIAKSTIEDAGVSRQSRRCKRCGLSQVSLWKVKTR